MAKMGRAYKYPKWAIETAAKNGISMELVRCRICKGMSLEDAINTPLKNKGRKSYPKWVYEKLEENNVTKNAFYQRIRAGMSLEEAVQPPIRKRGNYKNSTDYYWVLVTNDRFELPITVCEDAQELADYLGLKRNTIYVNILRGGVLRGFNYRVRKVKKIDC